jgi:hypothetical protein
VLAEEISLHSASQLLARRQPLHSRATLMLPTLPVQLLHNTPMPAAIAAAAAAAAAATRQLPLVPAPAEATPTTTTNCAPCHLPNIDLTIKPSLRDNPASHACGSAKREEAMLVCNSCSRGWLARRLPAASP